MTDQCATRSFGLQTKTASSSKENFEEDLDISLCAFDAQLGSGLFVYFLYSRSLGKLKKLERSWKLIWINWDMAVARFTSDKILTKVDTVRY